MRMVTGLIALALAPLLVSAQILSSDSKPTAYRLSINVSDLANSNTFNGSVQINITVLNPVSSLTLHAQNLTINTSSLIIQKKTIFKGWTRAPPSSVSSNGSLLVISFSQPMSSTDYIVSMDYQGTFQDTMAGFAKIGYHFSKTQRYLGVTSFEPTNARLVFPCYDEPNYRTDFVVEITTNKSQIVLSNVRPSFVHNITDTTKKFVFDLYPPMPVYQLGWVVMDQVTYILHSNDSSGTVVHTRAPYPYSNNTSWATALTSQLLGAMENYTGVVYPLRKLEQIVVPEFFIGTSEGYGIISYSEEAILVTPGKTSARYTQNVALGLARGVAEQWFGDIVSIDFWDNMWMMEGLNEYLKYTICASLPEMSDWELLEQMVVEMVQPALALDNSNQSVTVQTQDESSLVSAVYDDLTKFKGGSLMLMLRNILGDNDFNTALAFYVQKSGNVASNPTNLWNMMYEVAGDSGVNLAMQTVAVVMEQWTNSPGHPILNVTWNGTYFTITQSNVSQWYVPITYMLQSSPGVVSNTWLYPGSSVVVSAPTPQWILVNVNQTGFYRVNYNTSLWQLLANQLMTDLTQLPRLSRAQLIDDLFSLMLSASLPSDLVLQFTSYLKAETEYFPWFTALRNYQQLIDRMYGHSSYKLLQTYVLDLMNGVLAEVGMVSKPQDTHISKLKRSLVLEKACALGHPVCIQKAVSILRSWMSGTYFDPDLSTALLCAGVANSSTSIWQNLWSMYQYSVYPSVRTSILKALPCSRDIPLLNEFLNNITSTSNPDVSSKDKTILLKTLASTPFGAQVLLNWLIERLLAQTISTTPLSDSTTSLSPTTPFPTTPANPNSTDIPGAMKLVNDKSSEESDTSTTLTAKTMVSFDRLSDSDVTAILVIILPKLTTVEEGSKLDSFITQGSSTGLSYATLQLMQSATMRVYEQATWAVNNNAKLTTWLEEEAATVTPSGGSTKPTTVAPTSPTSSPSAAPGIFSSLALYILIGVIHLRGAL